MKKSKGLLIIALIFAALIILFVSLNIFGVISISSDKNTNGKIVVVDRGEVVISIDATGVVEAENEVFILSPSSSLIKKINKEPGTRVREGEVIIELDPEPIKNEIEDITDQLDVKRNSLDKSKLNNRSTLIDLDYNTEVKRLKITSLKSQLADEEQLLSVGGISPARLEETKQNITLAEKDLDMVIEKNEIRLKQIRADDEGLILQIKIQEKQLAEKTEILKKMEVKAPSDGILLTVSGKVGEKVNVDKMLVRMSDLTTFKIIGSIDEKYSEFIKTGNTVYALLENEKLLGTIGNVTPVVENSKIQFNVHIEKNNHPKLIPNQALNLQVVQSLKNNCLRLPESGEFNQNQDQIVHVKDSGRIVKRNVKFGVKGIGYLEIISGLNEGDQVIAPEKKERLSINETKK